MNLCEFNDDCKCLLPFNYNKEFALPYMVRIHLKTPLQASQESISLHRQKENIFCFFKIYYLEMNLLKILYFVSRPIQTFASNKIWQYILWRRFRSSALRLLLCSRATRLPSYSPSGVITSCCLLPHPAENMRRLCLQKETHAEASAWSASLSCSGLPQSAGLYHRYWAQHEPVGQPAPDKSIQAARQGMTDRGSQV